MQTIISILGPLEIAKGPYWCFLDHGLTNIYLSEVKGISNDPS